MKPKSEEIAELGLIVLVAELRNSKVQIAALRLMLERRGVTPQQLRQELREVQEIALVKRRAYAAFRPIRKAALVALQSAWNVRKLEQAPATGKPN
jgi:hypothetical protein